MALHQWPNNAWTLFPIVVVIFAALFIAAVNIMLFTMQWFLWGRIVCFLAIKHQTTPPYSTSSRYWSLSFNLSFFLFLFFSFSHFFLHFFGLLILFSFTFHLVSFWSAHLLHTMYIFTGECFVCLLYIASNVSYWRDKPVLQNTTYHNY